MQRATGIPQRLLVVGASGGVGAYAVQVGRALGAHVTGISSAASADFVRAQGADAVVDYTRTDPARLAGPYDVVFDTIGTFDYPAVAPMLAPGGRFAPLNFLLVDLRHARRARARGHRQVLRVNGDSKAGLMRLSAMVAAGKLRGVVDKVYPLSEIRAAYADVESRRRKGVVVVVPPAAAGTAQPELRAVG